MGSVRVTEKAVDFLKQFTRGMTDCCVNYKPYEHDNFVKPIPFSSAVENFISDYEQEMRFLECFGLDDIENKAFISTCNIWKNHIWEV